MACGTGKTLTALWVMEEWLKTQESQDKEGVKNDQFVLFLVPSLALLSQTMKEWAREQNQGMPQRVFAVCSDAKVGKNEEDLQISDLTIPPTTDASDLAKHLKTIQYGRVNVVFSTYQSLAVIQEAQNEHDAPAFDLVICDEAHRTTGIDKSAGLDKAQASKVVKPSHFNLIHDKEAIQAKKQLYMTATPRIYADSAKSKAKEHNVQVFSMDDKAVYGSEFYRLDFSEAVKRDLLTDYKVIVLSVSENAVDLAMQGVLATSGELKLPDLAKLFGCWSGLAKKIATPTKEEADALKIDPLPMKRAVAFCKDIKTSKAIQNSFANMLTYFAKNNPELNINLQCETQHVDGTMNALQRNEKLRWLKDESEKQNESANVCRILSNARCLSEGVDVPALDAVLFLNPRKSQIDVVQAVGRVMRKSEGKKYGYIILPIAVPASDSPEDSLNQQQTYEVVWQILQALRSHDDRFNAMINKLELNKKKPHNLIIGTPEHLPDEKTEQLTIDFPLDDFSNAIYAKLVLKCGDRTYWENWANDVATIAQRNIARINNLIQHNQSCQDLFAEFLKSLQANLNPSLDQNEAIEMLAQHVITKPVFNALFEGYDFAEHNPISQSMQTVLDLLEDEGLDKETGDLAKFYESVRDRAKDIDNLEGKQRIIIELYDKFFKTAFPKVTERLGIVYTPVEVVDFILHSVQHLLHQEFGRSLSDEGIHVLDPFTGTGTFITRLLQDPMLINDADLERKYNQELHANELVLLAYYIATINIENAFHHRLEQAKGNGKTGQQKHTRHSVLDTESQNKSEIADQVRNDLGSEGNEESREHQYQPFQGAVLTDTFQMAEKQSNFQDKIFQENRDRANQQNQAPIQVIIGNPPYSAGQRSANDNNQNLKYEILDDQIAKSYVKESRSTTRTSVYDSYIRAIKWGSERLGNKGIMALVTNAGWIESNSADGMRKCLQQDFSSIYVFHLRGNARTQGEQRRKEKDNIFEEGSRTPIAITFFVKNPESSSVIPCLDTESIVNQGVDSCFAPNDERNENEIAGQARNDKKQVRNDEDSAGCQIYYHDIGDYLTRDEKLKIIKGFGSMAGISSGKTWSDIGFHSEKARSLQTGWQTITPDKHHDWINQRDDSFNDHLQIGNKKDNTGKVFFKNYSSGVITQRDVWVYHSSKTELETNVRAMINFYNSEVRRWQKSNQSLDVKDFVNNDPTKMAWIKKSYDQCRQAKTHSYQSHFLTISLYRPFQKQWFYSDLSLSHSFYSMPQIFPNPDLPNKVICVSGVGSNKDFSCLIADTLPDIQVMFNGQCFPLFLYEKEKKDQKEMLEEERQIFLENGESYRQTDGITDFALREFFAFYSSDDSLQTRRVREVLNKENIFYYIYGILHSVEYREKFADNLSKQLPRIPKVKSFVDFQKFSQAGRELADLHLNYENVPLYPVSFQTSSALEGLQAKPDGIVQNKNEIAGQARNDAGSEGNEHRQQLRSQDEICQQSRQKHRHLQRTHHDCRHSTGGLRLHRQWQTCVGMGDGKARSPHSQRFANHQRCQFVCYRNDAQCQIPA